MKPIKSKTENIAEYILYLWQMEDYLRAFPSMADGNEELENYLTMMHDEGIMENGHLQLAINAIEELEDLHQEIIRQEETYKNAFKKLQPALISYRILIDKPAISDIETCLTFMYNILLLRLQNKTISNETKMTQEAITGILKYLSETYFSNFANK